MLKCTQGLCEYHFKKDDILRERKLLGSNGTVLGVVSMNILKFSHIHMYFVTHTFILDIENVYSLFQSTYKIPRLKEGVIPSLFPWTENVMENEQIVVDPMPSIDIPLKNKQKFQKIWTQSQQRNLNLLT